MSLQVTKRGVASWELTEYRQLWKGAHEYELVGRVQLEADGRYRCDVPHWQDVGHAWHRVEGKSFLTLEGACRFLETRKGRQS